MTNNADKLRILIVEDDANICKAFVNYVDKLDGSVEIVSITNNSANALSDTQDFLPDAVILDLELHNGGGNGIEYLSGLKNMCISPYILVTTNNSSKVTFDYVRDLGADFIMSKHQDNYSESAVIDFLKMMSTAIKNKVKSSKPESYDMEAPDVFKKRIYNRISSELDNIGINPKYLGYKYLTEAIYIMIEAPSQNLCSQVAAMFGKSDASVQRAMQNAIDKSWRLTPIDDLLAHYTAKFDSNKGAPTVTEFVCYYANKIRADFY